MYIETYAAAGTRRPSWPTACPPTSAPCPRSRKARTLYYTILYAICYDIPYAIM